MWLTIRRRFGAPRGAAAQMRDNGPCPIAFLTLIFARAMITDFSRLHEFQLLPLLSRNLGFTPTKAWAWSRPTRSMLWTRPPSTCASRCFPWVHFRSTKAAVKMHTLLDLRSNIPSFIHVSDGKLHDVHALDLLLPEARQRGKDANPDS